MKAIRNSKSISASFCRSRLMEAELRSFNEYPKIFHILCDSFNCGSVDISRVQSKQNHYAISDNETFHKKRFDDDLKIECRKQSF